MLLLLIILIYVLKQEEKVIVPPSSTVPSITVPSSTPGPRVEDQLIIKYEAGVSEQTINENLKIYNAQIIKRIDAIHRMVIQVPEGQGDAILNQLKKDNLIEEAEPDYINQAFLVPNDTSYNQQWGLSNTGQTIKDQPGTPHADINVEAAWDVTLGNGIVIAILDTGIDSNQPDLSGKITGKKDFMGIGIDDRFGHGTHIAGIAAATANNSAGISGVCPECKLIIGKILDDEGRGPDSSVSEGIIWAADNGAKVINISLGSEDGDSVKCDAASYAWNKGVVVVASTGNSSDIVKIYPAACTNVIGVASTDNKDEKSSFSNYGTWVNVAAPGSAIYSTLPTRPYKLQQIKPGLKTNYDFLSGTSMATPMVSGVVGLIWSSTYGTSASSVVQRLFNTADKISGTGQYWVSGRVNAGKAVGEAPTTIPTLTLTPPIPTNQPTLTQTPTPSSPYVSPTLYCLSGQPCTSITPTLPASPTTQITVQQPSIVPSEDIEPTNVVPSSSQQPSPASGGGKMDILQIIIEFIKKLLELILQLFALRP